MRAVLVLCTGNSCRSILAEGLINHLAGNRYHAVSAGSQPTGTVHPLALATLQRHGINLPNARSKSWDEFTGQAFDYVITVCDNAANETCPVSPHSGQRLHWPIPDPATVRGSHTQISAAFDLAYSMLKNHITNDLP